MNYKMYFKCGPRQSLSAALTSQKVGDTGPSDAGMTKFIEGVCSLCSF